MNNIIRRKHTTLKLNIFRLKKTKYFLDLTRSVSGSDKIDEIETLNRTKRKKVSDLVWFSSKSN